MASRLKTLRIRVDRLALALGGLAVITGLLFGLRAMRSESEHQALVAEGFDDLRSKPADARSRPRVRGYYSGAAREQGEGVAVSQPPPTSDPGDLGPAEAVASFQQVIGELEQLAESERSLSKREEAELYNRATGSFTALSAWVDANDSDELAMMNDSYNHMMALMRELDIQPPPRDPDANPFRR